MSEMLEHDHEVAPGMPAALPASERVLWRGQPEWRLLARTKFHIRKLGLYFAVVLGAYVVVQLGDGASLRESLAGGLFYVVLAAIALGLVAAFARATARATVFTITNRRVIIRCGVALPLSMNLPFSKVDSAEYADRGDGFGDIALLPAADSRASYILLWPYVRPWRISRVQPLLRAIPDAEFVAEKLACALEADMLDRESRPAEPEIPEIEPATAEATGRKQWKPYPTVPLAAAVGLVVVTVFGTGFVILSGNAPTHDTPVDVVASVELRFEDRSDGSIDVIDASSQTVLETLEPGDSGFIRSTLRGLARARLMAGEGDDVAFVLQQTKSGRLVLSDPVTERSVDLWAFGSTNARSFVRYLPAAENQLGKEETPRESGEQSVSMTTARLSNQE